MKNVQLSLIGFTVILATGFSCGKPSGKEVAKEFGQKMCYKMADCAQEQLKNIPAQQRQMAMGMLPSREKCDSAQNAARQPGGESEVKELTEEQIEMAKKCMAAMEKISCSDMQKGIPECQDLSHTMQ